MKKILLTSLLLITGFGLQGAAAPDNHSVMYYCPGTPPPKTLEVWNVQPSNKSVVRTLRNLKSSFNRGVGKSSGKIQRPKRVGKAQVRHVSDAIGTQEWERDITDKLNHLQSMLPPNDPNQADALRKSYQQHLEIARLDCIRSQDFLKKMSQKERITGNEVQIAHNYLEAIKKHLSDLSEIVYNLHEQNPQQAEVLQALVVNRDKMYQVIKIIDAAKDSLEDFMNVFGLLPNDYDNGLI